MHQYTHWKPHKMRERQMRARWHPNKLTHTHSEEHTASKHQQNTQIVFQTTTNNYNTNHKFTTKSRTSQSDIYKNIYIFIINVHISVITKKNTIFMWMQLRLHQVNRQGNSYHHFDYISMFIHYIPYCLVFAYSNYILNMWASLLVWNQRATAIRT